MEKKIGVGIIAFSNSLNFIDSKLVLIGLSKLESLGFSVKLGKNVYKKDAYCDVAGTVEGRLADINDFLTNDSIDIIMAVIGGYGANQLLRYLDYDLIKKTQKKFVGFSDTTVLLNAIYKKTGLCTFLGPSFVSFCNPSITKDTENYFFDVIINNSEEICYNAPLNFAYDDWFLKEGYKPRDWVRHPGYKFIRDGYADSIVVGGNCQSLLRLAGTPFFPDTSNRILILEDIPNESPQILISELVQLRDMGVLKNLSGLIIGQFGFINEFYKSNYFIKKILEICYESNFPILINVNFSHVDPLFAVKIGGRLIMDSNKNVLKLIN